jgi:hypothetical protein
MERMMRFVKDANGTSRRHVLFKCYIRQFIREAYSQKNSQT